MSFTVTNEELAATRLKADAVNKRAAKAGIAGRVSVKVVETREVKSTNALGFEVKYSVHEVEIVGLDTVKLGDWSLAAVLDHDAAGNIFRTVPGFEVEIPAEFRGTDAERCDHCNARRNRNETILVWNEAEGFKQVGSTCVKLFLGISPNQVIAFISEIEELADAESYTGSWGASDYTVSEFVAAASLVTAVYGFKPSSFDDSTKSVAQALIAPKRNQTAKEYFERRYPEIANPSEKDIARANTLAEEAIAWIAGEAGNSDYIANLKIAAAREALGRNAGLLASLPNAYKRHLGDVAEREAKAVLPASTHVGQVGDKVTVTGTVVYTNRSEGFTYYAPDALFIIVQGQDGNVFYINTTVDTKVGGLLEDASKDDVFQITGTVKAHKVTNKSQDVTVLTRTKAQEV